MNSKLLKEAIADAKAVRETALANAKIALEETGHDWQMLRQLVMTMPMEEIEYLIEERKSLGL